jgi:membrane dipeptidase
MPFSDEARALHQEFPAIDLHADTLMWSRWLGYDMLKRHEAPLPMAALGGHVDLPRLREGGVGAQFMGLVSLPITEGQHGLATVVHEQIDALEEQVVRSRGGLALAQTAREVEAINARGNVAALLGIEGAHALEGDIENIARFARRGVRYLGLLHFSANDVGAPAYGKGRDDDAKLTRFGREVVARCEHERVLVDLSHINKRGALDACSMVHKPLMVSHTGVLGAFEHWRNIDDEVLRAVANTGGCIGVMFCPRFLGGNDLGAVVKHLVHILNVAGEDAPALGSDWDGFIVPTPALASPATLPALTDALIAAGVPLRSVSKMLRLNALRVLETP